MKLLNRFRTVPYKLFLSFTVLIVLTTLIVGTTSSIYFTSNFNEEIENIHADMLSHTSEMIDTNILQKAEKVYVDLAMNPDLAFLFDNPIEGNTAKILDAQRSLNNAVRLYPDLLESISVYYQKNQIVLSSQQGITYLNDSTEKIIVDTNWIRQMDQSKSTGMWIGTRLVAADLGGSTGGAKLFTYVRTYPFAVTAERAQGYIAVNMKESALNSVIRSKSSADRGQLFIIDRQGEVISSDNSHSLRESVSPATLESMFRSGDTMDSFIDEEDGARSFVSHTTLFTTGWKLVKITSVEQFYKKSSSIQRTLIIICLIAVAVGLALANLFTVNLYNPLKALLQSLRQSFGPAVHTPTGKTLNEYTLINETIRSLSVKMTELETTVEENRPVIKHHFVSDWLLRANGTREEWEEQLNYLQINMGGPFYCALLIQFDERRFDALQMENKQIIIYNLIRELETIELDGLKCLAVSSSETSISVIANAHSPDDADLHAAIRQVRAYASQHFLMEPNAASGSWTGEPLHLRHSYREAQDYMSFSYFHPELSWFPDAVFREKGWNTGPFPDTLNRRFEETLKERDYSGALAVIQEAVQELKTGMYPAEQSHVYWKSFVAVYHAFVKGAHLKSEDILSEEKIRQFQNIGNIDEFQEWLAQVVRLTFAYMDDRSLNRSAEIVERVKTYIQQHLDRDLSLNAVAEQVHLNASYVSQLFKEESGINFVDYVTKLRMEKAAELILTTAMTLEQIAEQIGYNSATYLIKKFKQTFGVTPKTYKYNHTLSGSE